MYSPYVVPAPTVVVGRKLAAAEPANCKTAAEVVAQTPELSQLGSLVAKLSPKLRGELTNKAGSDFTFSRPTTTQSTPWWDS